MVRFNRSMNDVFNVEEHNEPQWLETGRCSPQYPITIFWRFPSQWK